jgi:hypothetical protein
MRIFLTALFVALSTVAIWAHAGQGGKADDQDVPKVTYCELIKHPEKFDDKVVEVTAIYGNGFEKSYLYDKDLCKKGMDQPQTWVAYDKSFVMEGDSEEAKTNSAISAFGVWEVTAIGRFKRAREPGRFGHMGCCLYQFNFMKIVHSEKLSNRVR